MNRSALPRPHWKWSLATRLAVVWALFIAMVVGISSWLAHRDGRRHLLESLRQGIEQDEGEISVRLETWMQGFQEDARACSQSPLLFEFLSRRNTAQESRWRRLLEQEFRAVFAGKPAYFQMRLLAVGGEEDGREILRLDRRDGRLEVTPRERLQSKADRTYYQEARSMPPNRIYLSEINLNRDFGGITEPHIPTIRAAAQVQAKGHGDAMLIINADLRPLFAEALQLASPLSEVRIVSSRGDYILHPDPEATFASDLGRGLRFHEEYPHAALAERQQWLQEGSQDQLALTKPVQLNGWPLRVLRLVVALPGHAWLPALESSRHRGMVTTTLAVMAGAGVAFLLSLPLINRLRRLSTAIRQFNAGGLTDTLTDSGKDEIGFAIDRFREMAEKVRSQIEKLSAARDEAEQANAAKEEFLAVMSHEIRTPMNAVVGLIRALEANHPPAHQLPILRSLRSSASHLMALLNTALDYTRLKEGAMAFAEEDFDAARLVEEVGQSFGPAALAKQLVIETEVPETLRVRGDPVRLRQIVNNLVSNAVKFTDAGFVRISLRRAGEFLECTVRDSGPGIDEADQERVFLPFVQARGGRRCAEPGAGLGLPVSRALIEQQGGELHLSSRPGEGTTMTVRLPFLQATTGAPAGRESTASVPTAPFEGLRLLYVEDVPSNQQVMEITLAGTGAVLTCVGSGGEALRLVESETFDLVLVDLQLPDMNGEDLARSLLAAHPALPLVAVTAQASAKASRACRDAGIRAVVLKPYTAEALFHAISTHTGRVVAGGSPPDTSLLEALHPRDPARAGELAKSIAKEMRGAARELSGAISRGGHECRPLLRQIRHQLTTAIATLQLRGLKQAFDDSLQEEADDSMEPVIEALERAASDLEKWSAAACEMVVDS